MIKTPLSTVIGGAFWTPGCTVVGGNTQSFAQLIKSLFANNEQGFAYDPNDLSTMFQDAAGTVPVTGAGQPVGLMLDKSKGLVLGNNMNTTGATGWTAGTEWSIAGDTATVVSTGAFTNLDKNLGATKAGTFYKIDVNIISLSGGSIRCLFGGNAVPVNLSTVGVRSFYIPASITSGVMRFQTGSGVTASLSLSSVVVKELAGNHAYQTTSAARPILQDAPRRIDFDAVDDRIITNLPAQLTGCTVIRSVPNIGTQILTGQTIPATYEDNKDHCGLIVINRALTATETSQITKLFNKAAGV